MSSSLKILGSNQAEIFPKLSFLSKKGFYLAGGTALAIQLHHRTSMDLDFYNIHHFDPKKLYAKISELFKNESVKIGEAKDTLFCAVEDVDLSFFWYSYPLIAPIYVSPSITT